MKRCPLRDRFKFPWVMLLFSCFHGDFIISKMNFITDTRRPGVCGSDFLVFYSFLLFMFFIALAFCLLL